MDATDSRANTSKLSEAIAFRYSNHQSIVAQARGDTVGLLFVCVVPWFADDMMTFVVTIEAGD